MEDCILTRKPKLSIASLVYIILHTKPPVLAPCLPPNLLYYNLTRKMRTLCPQPGCLAVSVTSVLRIKINIRGHPVGCE